MPRVATKLAPASRGGFIARKVIPADVRDDYATLYGQRIEERLNTGPLSVGLARAKHRDWLSEIEARIANIRAARKGEGRTLTPKESRALAGDWYHWFVAREADRWPEEVWTDYYGRMTEEIEVAGMNSGVFAGNALDLLETNPKIRERIRPVVADEAKTEQFLAAKRLALDPASRTMFLDYVARDFFAAIGLLARRARGDFSPDKWAEQFPQTNGSKSNSSMKPWDLFERWVEKQKPATSTVDRWRGVFLKLQEDYPNTNAAALLPEQMQEWANGLIGEDRTARTVMDVWVRSCRCVFGFAVDQKLIHRNPFVGWRVKVPRKIQIRETKAFTPDEIKKILEGASQIKVRSKTDAAKRWCPWICGYSGARIGEITQLRGSDVIEQDGIPAVKLSPEAGTIKTGKARIVPLHEHLIAQGFLEFVKASGQGPLFYNAAPKAESADPTNPKKPRYVKAREHVAAWVREIGVDDPELSPNHAWRHTFKAIGFRSGMTEKVIDSIVGHAPATVGRGYGEPTLADKASELRKFPRLPAA